MIRDSDGKAFAPPAPTDDVVSQMLEAYDVTRADRWENPLTGIGTLADKTVHGRFAPVRRLWDPEIVDMVNGSDLAAKGVFKRPEEMFREGYKLLCRDLDASAIEDFYEWGQETYDLDNQVQESLGWGGAFGGLLLTLGVDDGREQWQPVDESRVRGITFINKVDRRFAFAQSYYSNLDEPKYGQPETYLISNGVATSSLGRRGRGELERQGFSTGIIHESRCIRFDGVLADVTTQQLLAGWSWSVLQRPYDVLRQFDHIFDSIGYLVSDASQAVFKLRGLISSIGSGGKTALATRLQLLEETRSVARAIALDAGDRDGKNAETFERSPTTFTGLPDVADRFMLRLAAAFDMPPLELFGQGGGGLNSAGEAQAATRKWHESNRSRQRRVLGPKLRRLYHLLTFAKGSPLKNAKAREARWNFKFHPLQSPTDKELAETQLAQAQRDQIYIEQGVVRPEEVAVELGEVYPQLDVESREAALEAGKSHEPYPNDEDPPDAMPGMPGANGQEPEGGAAAPPLYGAQLGAPPKGLIQGPPPVASEGSTTTAKKTDAVPIAELPADFGTDVPRQGSSCNDCRFLAGTAPPRCGNTTFQGWAKLRLGRDPQDGAVEIPAKDGDPHLYCCSAWQAKDGVLDAHDPARPRATGGKWAEEHATMQSRIAGARSDLARVGGARDHLEAARAHATAAEAHRALAIRHEGVGNKGAAAGHRKVAAGHDRRASEHLIASATTGA